MRRPALVLLIVGAFAAAARGQTVSLRFAAVDVGDLEGGVITAMADTPEGYLWLVVRGRLLRFDGRSTRWFEPRLAGWARSLILVDVVPDGADGALLLGTDRGLLRYDPGSGSVDPLEGAPAAVVHDLQTCPDGRVIAATAAGLLQVRPDVRALATSEGFRPRFLAVAGADRVLAADGRGRVDLLSGGGFETVRPVGAGVGQVWDMAWLGPGPAGHEAPGGEIVLATDRGVRVLPSKGGEELTPVAGDDPTSDPVSRVFVEGGAVLTANRGGGLGMVTRDDSWRQSGFRVAGAPVERITAFHRGRTGYLFVATTAGLHRSLGHASSARHWVLESARGSGVPVRAVLASRDGIWIGSAGEGLLRRGAGAWRGWCGEPAPIGEPGAGVLSDVIVGIAETPRGVLVAGPIGVRRYPSLGASTPDARWVLDPERPPGDGESPRGMAGGAPGVFLGTDRGLWRLRDPAAAELEFGPVGRDGPAGHGRTEFGGVVVSGDDAWAVVGGRLFRWIGAAERFAAVPTWPPRGDAWVHLWPDGAGAVLALGDAGDVVRVPAGSGAAERVWDLPAHSTGAPSNVFRDDLSRVWVATERGLFVRQSCGAVSDFADLMRERDVRFITASAARHPSGVVLLGTDRGVLRLDASHFANDLPTRPTLTVTAHGTGVGPHEQRVRAGDDVEVSASVRGLDLGLTLVELGSPARHRFQYRLSDGEDPGAEWIETPSAWLHLHELPAGEHRVEVRGFVDPARASAPLEFTVSVAAPFWRRPATLAAVAVAAVVLLAVGARVRRRHRAALSRLEAQVRHVQRLESLGVLAGGIAHDFNNLLTTMLGHAELVEQQLPPGHAARQNLGPIRAAATQAGKLTRQMLDYAGKGSGMREVVDLRQVLADMESLLRASVPRWIRLEVRSGAAPILVHGERAQLEQVFLNLVMNGAEALVEARGGASDRGVRGAVVIDVRVETPDASRIARMYVPPGAFASSGGASPNAAFAVVEVSDDGCGIAPDVLPRVFDPFFTTRFAGRGLGLASVLGIVCGHDGGLGVATRVGEGTRVTVLLPLVSATASAAVTEGAPSRPPETGRRDPAAPAGGEAADDPRNGAGRPAADPRISRRSSPSR